MSIITAFAWLGGAFGVGLFIGLSWRPARAVRPSKEDTSR